MEWILGIGVLYLFLQIVVPLVVLSAIAYLAYRWANRNRPMTFSSSEPDTTEEWRMELEDVHDPDDHPPRV